MAYKSIGTIKDSPHRKMMRELIERKGIKLPNASVIYDYGLISYLELATNTTNDPRIMNRQQIEVILNGLNR